jgi:DNA-binding NarL/FixJ family response regulator
MTRLRTISGNLSNEGPFDREVQQESQIMMNLDHVSPREQQVLNLLVQGFSNKGIGELEAS